MDPEIRNYYGSQPEATPEHRHQILTESHQVHDLHLWTISHTAPHPQVRNRSRDTRQIYSHRTDSQTGANSQTQNPTSIKIRDPGQLQTSHNKEAQEENFAKSTIHIARSSGGQPQFQARGSGTDPQTQQIHRHRVDPQVWNPTSIGTRDPNRSQTSPRSPQPSIRREYP
jgi:hypothetical protein